jgi:hypothetical protein
MNSWVTKNKNVPVPEVITDEQRVMDAVKNLIVFMGNRQTKFLDASHRIFLLNNLVSQLKQKLYALKNSLIGLVGGDYHTQQQQNFVTLHAKDYKDSMWKDFTIFAINSIITVIPILVATLKILTDQAVKAQIISLSCVDATNTISNLINSGVVLINETTLRSYNFSVADFDANLQAMQSTSLALSQDFHDLGAIIAILGKVSSGRPSSIQKAAIKDIYDSMVQIQTLTLDIEHQLLHSASMQASPLIGEKIFEIILKSAISDPTAALALENKTEG